MSQLPVYLVLSLPLIGAIAMFALGIVVIFQASRVLNLAHGAMAMVPAYACYEVSRHGLPVTVAVPVALVVGAGIGIAVEILFVRQLAGQGPTGQTVGTVAAFSLLVSGALKFWGSTPRTPVHVFSTRPFVHVGASVLSWGQVGLFVTALVATVVFFLLFLRTNVGFAMRLVADNRGAAALMGVDPDRTTIVAWALGGGLAGLAGVLLAATTTLHPVNLSLVVLPAFVAALIGGLDRLVGALVGSAVVGFVLGMVPALSLVPGVRGFATQSGAPQLVLAVLAFAVMTWRGARLSTSDVRQLVTRSTGPAGDGARGRLPWLRAAGVALAIAWPFLVTSSLVADAINAFIVFLVAASLVVLTGWVGQISLAQASFVGLGAFTTAQVTNRWGIGFPFSLVFAVAVAALVAGALGAVALRVRGLYLAVSTLIFLWMSSEFLFRSSWLVGTGGSASIPPQRIGHSIAIAHFDLTERRTFYFVALAVAATTAWGLANLRDSRAGRSFFAVRGSEVAAASLGIDVTRCKLVAFAIAGGLAGAAGNLVMVHRGAASPSQFDFQASLLYLGIAVVGGVTSLGGAAAASVLFALLNELFFRVALFSGWLDFVAAGLLALVLVARPRGLASFARPTSRRWPQPAAMPDVAPRACHDGDVVLAADGVSVQFGGVRALHDVSITVHGGQIVGLIGPNGAGKTTLFNVVSGLVTPAAGTVRLLDRDVTPAPVHTRVAAGLARTFQVIQLFPELTVFDNLLIATHVECHSSMLANVLVTRTSLAAESAARERVHHVIALLDLSAVAHRPVAGLPFGTLRLVELARAIVTGAPVVMLDEIASGLDTSETATLTDRLRSLRSELGLTILLIEHDVAMVADVCDYVYVLDRGRLLAEGTPTEVQRDPAVIAAYLGQAAPVPA